MYKLKYYFHMNILYENNVGYKQPKIVSLQQT